MEFVTIDIIIMLLGVVLGLIAGMLPGIGNVVVLMLTYPFIQDYNLFQIILFYVCLAGAAQYTGSVVATTLAVPGETSSLPAVSEGHKLFRRGMGNYAISNSAIGSFVGAGLAATIMLIVLPLAIWAITKFYNTHIQVILLLVVSFFLIVTYGDQKWYHNLMLFAIGWFLASIGFSRQTMNYRHEWLIDYEKFEYLHFGIPLYPTVIALFVLPIFIRNWDSPKPDAKKLDSLWDKQFFKHLKEYIKNIGSSIRGTVVGSLCGLVPHLTSTLASNVAYVMERRRSEKKNIYNTNGDLKSLVSAETANNAAGLTCLTPLLLIGIPITTSEAIVLNIIENNMEIANWQTTVASGMFNKLVVYFIFMNMLCVLAAWPFAKHLHVMFKVNQKILYASTFAVLVLLVYYLGNITQQGIYYLTILCCLAPLGYVLRRWDTLIVVFAFIMQKQIEAGVIRLFYIYSDIFTNVPGA